MTRRTTDIPSIKLLPLEDDELNAVGELLAAELHQKRNARKMTATLANLILKAPVSISMSVETNAELKRLNPKPWKRSKQVRLVPEKELWASTAVKSLLQAQRKWRNVVHGPSMITDGSKSDFDDFQIESQEGFRLPEFTIENERVHRSRRMFRPTLRIRIDSAADMFNWLLVRAAINRQISRFAHCVVCGRWELKKIAGQRSARIVEFVKRHPASETGERNLSKWPGYMFYLPAWPGLCSRDACKSKFNSIFPDRKRKGNPRSKFQSDQFRGLWF
jgi:hypothetical protein